jgi:transposase-like protein
MIVFPAICPACASDAGRRIIPESPEVQTFRCARCQHTWSEPAPTYFLQEAEDAPPRRRFRLLFPRKPGQA